MIKGKDGSGNLVPVLVDSSGRIVADMSGTVLDGKVGSDGTSGGPYYLLTDLSGQLMLGSDGSSSYVLETDSDGAIKLASHTDATTSDRVEEIKPLTEKHKEETLLSLTDIATNTTDYAYLDMDGYRYFVIHGETSGTGPTDVLTVTIEATVQDDGTACESITDWQDVTNALFGVDSWEDTDFMAICDTPVAFKYVRVKYNTSNDSGGDCDLTVYAKRLW